MALDVAEHKKRYVMAQRTSKSAGWRFQSSRQKADGLIQFNGRSDDALDNETLNQLAEQVQGLETEDLSVFLNIAPPIQQLIQQIPYSLPLLEAVYLKCELLNVEDGVPFPVDQLLCEQLFCQLVWWAAFCEQQHHNIIPNRKMPNIQELEPCVGTILGILSRQCIGLVDRAQSDKKQLGTCLENLGCHGLVNCSSGLIRMGDAVNLEIVRHAERIRSLGARIKETTETKGHFVGFADPSIASHQRQMSLRLSEVFERLKHNELVEAVLEESLNNPHLSSLLRIVRKRVHSDRMLIGLFNAFNRASPDDFSFEQLDPVVAKLIVVFNNAYDKLLTLCPPGECDSGCSADGSTESRESSNGEHNYRSRHSESPQTESESNERRRSKSSNLTRRFRSKRQQHHSSLSNITITSDMSNCKSAKSLSNISDQTTASENPSPMEMRRVSAEVPARIERDDTMKLRLHIDHLKNELTHARRQISHLSNEQRSPASTYRLWPEPDYPDATSYYNCSSTDDVGALVGRFSDLFHKGRNDIVPTLDQLPEFGGSEELQLKTILSVVVLTYRSVLDSVHKRRERIWTIIQEGDAREETEESASLDVALFRHMYRRAKSQHGMSNAKEVTSQIWQTLYDFPCLKTCTQFNRFVLECVDVSWDLVAGIDGRYPRLRLEYEGVDFDDSRHSRSAESSPSSLIRQFLWPALVDTSTEKILLKAVVIT